MKNSIFLLNLLIAFLIIQPIYGQKQRPSMTESEVQKKYPKAKPVKAKKISAELFEKWNKERKKAVEIALRHNLPIRRELGDGKVLELQRFKNGRPDYYITYNQNAAKTISTDLAWELPHNLNGDNIIAGIWDEGKVLDSHTEFSGRVVQKDTSSNLSRHATHVSGTIVATGLNVEAHGMAAAAYLDAYDWNADLAEMFGAPQWIQVSNHSYGRPSGWLHYYGDWYWQGDTLIDADEDYYFGFYTIKSDSIDAMINGTRPYHLVLAAASNDRDDEGPGVNGGHFVWSASDTSYVWSTTTRQKDGGANGFDCIPGGMATAKNVLTVGAVLDIPGHYSSSGDVIMTSFSSWGPTDDGRIKPDVVANGYELTSPSSTGISDYETFSGTSMATPTVSGSVILLLQEIENLFQGRSLLASTIKALIIHTADEAGDAEGPDYKYGWGLMNTKKAIDVINQDYEDNAGSHISEDTYDGTNMEIDISAFGGEPLTVTLCWSDLSGTPPDASLNPTDKMLVNDLDTRLIGPSGAKSYPYVLNKDYPADAASKGDNSIDNVEKIYLAAATEGNYKLKITHKGSGFTQDFSVIVTGGEIIPDGPPSDPNGAYVSIDNNSNSSRIYFYDEFSGDNYYTWESEYIGDFYENDGWPFEYDVIYSPGVNIYSGNKRFRRSSPKKCVKSRKAMLQFHKIFSHRFV